MRRRMLALLAACFLLLGHALAQPVGYIVDQSQLLTVDEADRLEARCTQIAERYQCGVYVFAVWDYREFGNTAFDAACNLYTDNDLGVGEDKDGILLMLSMAERDFSTAVYGPRAHAAFPDYTLERQEEEYLDNFRYDEWYAGFSDFLTTSEQCLAAAEAGTGTIVAEIPLTSSSSSVGLPPALHGQYRGKKALTPSVVGVTFVQSLLGSGALATVICLILKSGMKSVRGGKTAAGYMDQSAANLTRCDDRYTHSTQTRRTIQTNSGGSRSGGGSHSHHSGGFSGRSGKF